MKKALALGLAIAMIFSLAACGSGTNSSAGGGAQGGTAAGEAPAETAAAGEEVVISMWIDTVENEGIQTTPIADEFARRTGVRINAVKGDSDKFKVLQGANDLPGIIFINGPTVPANQMVALDDLIESHGKELKENYKVLLEYSRNFLTTDGNIYYLPVHQYKPKQGEDRPVTQYGAHMTWFGRWDVYEQAGFPEVEVGNVDSFLEML